MARRLRAGALALVAVLLLSGCGAAGARLGGERRLISLYEQDLPEGALTGSLAYVEARGVHETGVYVHDLAANRRQRLRSLPDGHHNAPAWSPDGRRLAVSHSGSDAYSRIWIVDAVMDRAQPLTEGAVIDDYPRWSPSGQELVFSSIRDGSPDWRLYRVGLSASARPRLVRTPRGHSIFPDWSLGGRWIVYAHRAPWGPHYKLRLHDLSSGEDRVLTQGPGDDLYPRFSPSGDQVVFSSNRDEVWQIHQVDLATGAVERLIGSDSMDEFPMISPDGTYLAFSAGHLALYRRDGEQLAPGVLRWRLTRNLAWSPDWRPRR